MKKQFAKIKIAAENLSRSTKPDRKDFELEVIEKQVEKYRDVLEKMVRKLPTVAGSIDPQEREKEKEKRVKKCSHYKIGIALEESSKELTKEMPLQHALSNCGQLEKALADCIVDSELDTETGVVRRLKLILDEEIQEISTLKRNVTRTVQEYASLKRNYEAAVRLVEPEAKIKHIKEQQEQCEIKLEKERDQWAAQMFELIAKEDVIVQCIRDYVMNQRNYHERALREVNTSLAKIHDIMQSTEKTRFGTSLSEHLTSSNRNISYIIELCVCCLLENGLDEEGLLRVGCASTKLRRMKHALEAQYVKTPLPLDYQDPHVIGSILKLYLRELPEPILTYKYYKDFIKAAERSTETERKQDIKSILTKLPSANFDNLRYLTKFLWLVTQNVSTNKMSSQNLAIVMAPNMLWPQVDARNPAADYIGQVNSSSAANIIVELLISHWNYFFGDEDVEFFLTLQRQKLFVERKPKSNSSNENLDKHENEMLESPRYGTIRRQKANAPSPPTKAQANEELSNGDIHIHKNGVVRPHAKELFPNGSYQSLEKPEKPPLPKQLLLNAASQASSQTNNVAQETLTNSSHVMSTAPPPPPVVTTPKPVPMTRTQFFGLDTLPSPVADRKSLDNFTSMSFKPDLPLKPKIPKRPAVLGLNANSNKSDDENSTPTPTQANIGLVSSLPTHTLAKDEASTGVVGGGGGGGGGNGGGASVTLGVGDTITNHLNNNNNSNNNSNASEDLKKSTDLLIEQLRQENLNEKLKVASNLSLTASNLSLTASNNSLASNGTKDNTINNSNQRLIETEQLQSIAPDKINKSQMQLQHYQPPGQTFLAAQSQSQSQIQQTNSQQATSQANHQRQITPTTPISPNMFQAPKRPTVPAPPPPSVIKK